MPPRTITNEPQSDNELLDSVSQFIYSNIKVCEYTTMFYAVSTKGNNFCVFLFASLNLVTLLKWILLLKERICYFRSKFFLLGVDPD